MTSTQPTAASLDTSSASLDSFINELGPEQSRFYSVFRQRWELFNVKVISCQLVQPHHLFGAKFIKYQIRVITDHICYTVVRRYRDFLELYRKVAQLYTPKVQFPPKTHIRSKVCPLLTERRRKIFDEFMQELIAMRHSNKSVVTEFLAFVNLREHYEKRHIDENIFEEDLAIDSIKKKQGFFGQTIKHELLKMSVMPESNLKSLSKIETYVGLANKAMVKMEDLRALILGGTKIHGLIEIAVTAQNDIVALTCLKLIKKFVEPEACSFCDAFKRILQSAPSRLFMVQNQQLLVNGAFKSAYFQFFDFYLDLKFKSETEYSLNSLLKQALQNQTIQEFKNWKGCKKTVDEQIRRKTSMNLVFDKILLISEKKAQSEISQLQSLSNHSNRFNQQIICVTQKNVQVNRGYKQIKRQGDSYCQLSSDSKLLHIHMQSPKSFEQIQNIINSWSHHSYLKCKYETQKLTKICKVFLNFEGQGEKLFQFRETISKQDQQTQVYEVIYTPLEQLRNATSFFAWFQVSQLKLNLCQVRILYYFHSNKVRKLFQKQLSTEVSLLWKGCLNSFMREEIQNSTKSEDSLKKILDVSQTQI